MNVMQAEGLTHGGEAPAVYIRAMMNGKSTMYCGALVKDGNGAYHFNQRNKFTIGQATKQEWQEQGIEYVEYQGNARQMALNGQDLRDAIGTVVCVASARSIDNNMARKRTAKLVDQLRANQQLVNNNNNGGAGGGMVVGGGAQEVVVISDGAIKNIRTPTAEDMARGRSMAPLSDEETNMLTSGHLIDGIYIWYDPKTWYHVIAASLAQDLINEIRNETVGALELDMGEKATATTSNTKLLCAQTLYGNIRAEISTLVIQADPNSGAATFGRENAMLIARISNNIKKLRMATVPKVAMGTINAQLAKNSTDEVTKAIAQAAAGGRGGGRGARGGGRSGRGRGGGRGRGSGDFYGGGKKQE